MNQETKASEPVGEVYRYGKDSHGREWHGIHWYSADVDVPTGTKLYTAPPDTEALRQRVNELENRGNCTLVPTKELKAMQQRVKDADYIITAFENGCDPSDYWRDISDWRESITKLGEQ